MEIFSFLSCVFHFVSICVVFKILFIAMASSSLVNSSAQCPMKTICSFCNSQRLINWICNDCDDFLCDDCMKDHFKVKTSRDHKVLYIGDSSWPQIDKERLKPRHKPVPCQKHKKNVCNYCVWCRELVCPECLVKEHNKHELAAIDRIHKDKIKEIEQFESIIEEELIPVISGNIKYLDLSTELCNQNLDLERKKIYEQDTIFKQKLTDYTNKLLNQLMEDFEKNKCNVSREKERLEKTLQELKEKLFSLKKLKHEESLHDLLSKYPHNINNYARECNTAVKLRQKVKKFQSGEVIENSISEMFGSLRTSELKPPKLVGSVPLGRKTITKQSSLAAKGNASPPRSMSSPTATKMKTKKTSLKTQLQPIDPDILKDGKRYYDLLTNYCKTHHISDLKFETMPTKLDRMYCYTSTTKIHDRVYGSGGLFGSSVEAEFAACRTVCVALGLLNESPVGSSKQSPTSVDEQKIVKTRVKEILSSKVTGMWSTRLPIEYKKRFKEDPPGNILELVKSWKDVASVEHISIAKVDIFYPVKDVPVPVQAIPAEHQAIPPLRKDFRIPQGKPLPLGVKVTVYATFLHDVSSFCVQREDCPIDTISDELAHLAQDSIPDEKDLTRGKFVAAMYSSDGTWSRAKIVSDKPSKSVIEVLFVDFGNEEKCKTSDIRWLSEKSASYPVQTVYCSLYGIQPLKGEDDWSKELLTKFADLVKEEPVIAITQSYTDGGVCKVDLFLKEDKDISINQKLINLGLVRALE